METLLRTMNNVQNNSKKQFKSDASRDGNGRNLTKFQAPVTKPPLQRFQLNGTLREQLFSQPCVMKRKHSLTVVVKLSALLQ